MRRLLFIILCLPVLQLSAQKVAKTAAKPDAGGSGYNINVTVAPFKKCWLYMGCYYGKYKNLVDSVFVNENSSGTFKGKEKLPGGIYFMVSPSHTLLFDFLMDSKQQFSIKADTTKQDAVVITGSDENSLFQEYTQRLATKVPHLQQLQKELKDAKTKQDSTRIQDELTKGNKELNDYRDQIAKEHPDAMLTLFFNSMKRPEVPEAPKLPNGNIDSLYPARYMKEHYWDDVPFNDDRLLRTPFFDPKVDEYYKYYVSPEPDSVIAEVNYMLLYARESKDMFKYLLGKFTDKYINPEIMGQDKVFIFLFNNYFSKGDTTWLNAKQKEYIFNRAYSLMANQIGEQGAQLDLTDTSGKVSPLYGVKAPFTFLVFWDPHCGHCKEQVPKVDSAYEASWKAMGVKVYAVNTDEQLLKDGKDFDKSIQDWKAFIREHNLNGWVHVYQPPKQRQQEVASSKAGFRQMYDVFQTPTMYLLDDQKRIIAKKLSLEQFTDLMKAKLKK